MIPIAAASLATTTVMANIPVQFIIKNLPHFHPPGSDLYLAGNFNGWNPKDPDYRLKHDKDGYSLNLYLPEGIYDYKITRGGWPLAECLSNGKDAPNRQLVVKNPHTVVVNIEEWVDRFPETYKESTASVNVSVLDEYFYIPQLKRTRRIWMYLPKNYHDNNQRYPVIYMQDGQNLFDAATAYAGEWGVDEFMDATQLPPAIIVGIDNGGLQRMNEYSLVGNNKFGKSEGKAYLDFLVTTLKPFIDKNYRTLASKEHTSIAGSSMGGLISLSALLIHPAVFGAAGVFSPSIWYGKNRLLQLLHNNAAEINSRVYLYCGKQENKMLLQDIQEVKNILEKYSAAKVKTVIRPGGQHNEASWNKEFSFFYSWLMQ